LEFTIHQRHRQTDRQTTCDRNTALCTKVHRAVKSLPYLRYNNLAALSSTQDYTGSLHLPYRLYNHIRQRDEGTARIRQ